MLVIKVELHRAKTGEIVELSRMTIANVGGTDFAGDYKVWLAKPTGESPDGVVIGHRRSSPVWSLVYKALRATGFT